MRTVTNLIEILDKELRNEVVMVTRDNTTAVNYINKEYGTHSFSLKEEFIKLFKITMSLSVQFRARHFAGSQNLAAATLSREGKDVPMEWSLSESLCKAWSK